jgi:hypothetical protein
MNYIINYSLNRINSTIYALNYELIHNKAQQQYDDTLIIVLKIQICLTSNELL